jgi:hypothetical protein
MTYMLRGGRRCWILAKDGARAWWLGLGGEGEVEDASVVLPVVHEEHLVVVLIGGHEVRVPFDEGRATGLGTQALGPRCTQRGSQSLDWMRSAAKTLRSIGRA